MRKAFSLLYWLMAAGLGASVALSATVGAYCRPAPATGAMVEADVTPESVSGRRCARELANLFHEQAARAGRTFVGDGGPSGEIVKDWSAWSADWRARLQERRAGCRLAETPAMASLDALAVSLERLNLAYTTAVTGFSDVEAGKAFEALDLAAPVSPP